jgi:hypothetical protein
MTNFRLDTLLPALQRLDPRWYMVNAEQPSSGIILGLDTPLYAIRARMLIASSYPPVIELTRRVDGAGVAVHEIDPAGRRPRWVARSIHFWSETVQEFSR